MGRKIKNYGTSVEVGGNDKWIGSDASRQDATMNFTPDILSLYYAKNGYVEPGRLSILLTYQAFNTDAKGVFNISGVSPSTPVILNIEDLTTVYVSKLDNNRINQLPIWEYYRGGSLKIITPETIKAGSYGFFILEDVVPYIEDDQYLALSLRYVSGSNDAIITPGDVVSITPIASLEGGGIVPNNATISLNGGVGIEPIGIFTLDQATDETLTVDLSDTKVIPGAYTNANIIVDQQGRIIEATDGTDNVGADGLSITEITNLNLLRGTEVLSTVTLPEEGGADELSITDTNKLNLLEDGTILSTVTLPESGGDITEVEDWALKVNPTEAIPADKIQEIAAQPDGGSVDAFKFWEGTNAERDALSVLDPNTLYSTTDDSPTLIPDGLSITDTDKLNLLDGTSVLSTVTLPAGGGGGEADSIIRQPGGNTIEPLKFWTGTRAEYDTLLDAGSIAEDIHYNIIDDIGGGANTGGGGGTTQNLFQTIGGITANSPTDTLNIVGGTNVTITPDTATDTITIDATGSGGGGAADSVVRQPNGSTIAPIKFWTGTKAQYDALTREADVLYNVTDTSGTLVFSVMGTSNQINVNTADGVATVSIDSAITDAINTNTGKVTFNSTASNKLNLIEDRADVTDTANVVGSLTAGANITIQSDGTISAQGGSSGLTAIEGTANQVDVTRSGQTATVSLDSVITGGISTNTTNISTNATNIATNVTNIATNTTAIGLNTLKNSYPTADATKLATLSADSIDRQTGGSTTDPIKIWTGTQAQYNALTKQNDVLYNVTDTTGTVIFSISGTANEVDVNTVNGVSTVSLDTAITSAISTNTNKVSFPGLGTTSTTAKAGDTRTINNGEINKLNLLTITQTVNADTLESDTAINNAKITYPASASTKLATIATGAEVNVQSDWNQTTTTADDYIENKPTAAIDANTAKRSYPVADENKLATLSADSVDRQANGSTTDPIKFWSGTQAQYAALTPVNDVLYNITDSPNDILLTSVVGTTNEVDVNITGTTATVSLDSAITTKLNGIEAGADKTDTANVVSSLTAGNNITIASDGTIATTSTGTVSSISVGAGLDIFNPTTTPTINLDLTEVPDITGSVASGDEMVLLNSSGQGRKSFNEVGVSVFNNDANYSTTTGTVTSVTGTSPITVSTGTTTPVIGFNFGVVNTFIAAQLFGTIRTNVVTGVGDSNTLLDLSVPDTLTLTAGSVDFIDCVEAGTDTLIVNSGRVDMDVDFRKNTAGSWLNYNAGTDTVTFNATAFSGFPSTPQVTVIGTSGEIDVATVSGANTVSLDTTITGAITANTTKLATLSADSVDRQTGGSTTDPVKFWSGTTAQYDALTPASDVLYNITDTPTDTNISSVVGTTNEVDVTVSGSQATISLDTTITSAIALNTSKNSYPTADSTKLAGIETAADVTDTDNVVASLTAGDNITISAAGVIAASGGGSVDAIEFMTTSYGFESDLSGAGGVFNFNSYTSTHSGTLNGFMRFYTNGALTANAFYTGGATLRATTVAGTITLPTIDSNGNAIPAYTAGQSLVITNPAGDVFTANLASEVTTGLPTDFPTDLSPWRTSTTEVSAGFPADVVGDIFSTETVAVANQVFNQGALIYYLTEGYQKTSAGTLTTVGTAAEIPTVDTANDWTTTTAAGTSTTVLGTAGEIDVTTVGSTATASLNTAITGAITNNTAKTGISTAQATAITDNTAKTGISTAQATAITTNTGKTSFPGFGTTSTTALRGDTSFPSLTAVNAWTNTNAFNSSSSNGSIQIAGRIVHAGDTNTYIEYTPDQIDIVAGGVPFIRTQEGTDNQLRFNGSNNDVDYYFGNSSGSEWMTYNSGTNAAVIGAGSLTVTNGIARETGGSTTDGVKFWSGTEAQYNALGTGRDQNTVYYVT